MGMGLGMRITTGKYKGRNIAMPKGIRPTQDKVRKAIFDILGDIEGLSFLELYAGSGAVGFEALSRGASEAVMVEYNRDCQLAIKENIETLKDNACSLYPHEAEKAIFWLHKNGRRFDIIFLDPPYYVGNTFRVLQVPQGVSLAKKTLQTLGAYDILSPNGLVIAQHFKRDELPEECGQLVLVKEAKYGDTVLSIYRKEHVSGSDISRNI
jgi:16S rRNA (guanine(966)-N(2))-methyltransferase RsmD